MGSSRWGVYFLGSRESEDIGGAPIAMMEEARVRARRVRNCIFGIVIGVGNLIVDECMMRGKEVSDGSDELCILEKLNEHGSCA